MVNEGERVGVASHPPPEGCLDELQIGEIHSDVQSVFGNAARHKPTAVFLVDRYDQVGQPQTDALLGAEQNGYHTAAPCTELASVQLGRQITCVIDQWDPQRPREEGCKKQSLRHAIDLDRDIAVLDLRLRQRDERSHKKANIRL